MHLLKSNKALKIGTLLLLLQGLLLLSGCGSTTLFLINERDIVSMPTGKTYTAEVDGWFISDFYLQKVAEAKVER